jgi:hemerythrin
MSGTNPADAKPLPPGTTATIGPSFQWGPVYLTGIPAVDEQHRGLVDLINELGRLIGENVALQGCMPLFARLTDYARDHFSEEEAMMVDRRLDARHVDIHRRAHQDFLAEVTAMATRSDLADRRVVQELMSFLTHWLTYHILGMDQQMAAQARDIAAGASPQAAFDDLKERDQLSTAPLLGALNGLFELVSSRNRELAELNASLERKVDERTEALAELNHQLEDLAMTDTLTDLPNRRHAMCRLTTLWKEAVETGSPLACMMIDADHFKAINDTHGHEAGDVVLRELASTLRDAVRNDDVVCRLGGDEFFIICPATDDAGARRVADLVLRAVNGLHVAVGDGAWHGSVSIGSAVRRPDMTSHEELIRRADGAVYAAKHAGKNCARHSD